MKYLLLTAIYFYLGICIYAQNKNYNPNSVQSNSCGVKAAFKVDTNSGCSVVCVNFTDQLTTSKGSINSWLWNFGDGFTSNSQNPNHCYAGKVGNFSVKLIVSTNIGCSDTASQNNLISIYGNPLASFTPLSGVLINPVQFINKSTDSYGTIVSWFWSFGDGNTSTYQNPLHTFQSGGTYCPYLKVTDNNGCYDSTVNCDSIVPTGLPNINKTQEKVSISPNPSYGAFTITLTDPELITKNRIQLEMYNLLGERIYDTKLNAINTQIDFSNNATGIYFYRALTETGGLISIGKIILQGR